MTDNKITREMTFSEELPYFKERIKEVFDNFDNPDGYADILYLSALRDSHRIVRKAEEEINSQQAEIEQLKFEIEKLLPKGCPYAIQVEVSKKLESQIKSEAVKECLAKVENYIKTHCNPYGKPDFEYDTSIKILNFIDNLVKEMADEENVTA